MALTSEDIWHKFELINSSTTSSQPAPESNQNLHCQALGPTVLKSSAMLTSTATAMAARTSISKIMDTDCLVVPDIGDILSDTNLDLDINLDGGIDMDFDYLLDDFLSTKEPLRHDCMWSGERDPLLMSLQTGGNYSTKSSCSGNTGEETVVPNLDLAASQGLSCFDTPLSSETSDLDETSSDLEGDVYVQRTSCADRLLPSSPDSCGEVSSSSSSSPVHFFSDHSYVATSRYQENNHHSVLANNHERLTVQGVTTVRHHRHRSSLKA
jgi:hypothetical protein